jgi:MoaA/NifB/PqqE/SkfB family radical SAM enzyme
MNNLYIPKNIKSLEIEATNFCNAFCGECDRNINGGELRNDFDLTHMQQDIIFKLFTKKNLEHIDRLHFDGNLGDASMHPLLIEILEHISSIKSDLAITMSTNGGARSVQFWKNLAEVLQKFRYHIVNFSIDGLEDTNHIYRRGVIWKNLENNLRSFNAAGGNSVWRMIVFNHNKHQIKSAIDFAKNTGCTFFITEKNRLTGKEMYCKSYKKFPETVITSPDIEDFEINYKVVKNFKKLKESLSHPFFENLYSCPFGQEGKVSIDVHGNIWPCCFFYSNSIKQYDKTVPMDLYRKHVNIKENSYNEILDFINKDLYSAWDADSYTLCKKCLHKTMPPAIR